MNWKGKKVLVTGAGGFIGSHLTEKLVELGADTRALVHYRSDGTWGWLDTSVVKNQIEVLAGDIRDQDSVHRAVEGCYAVFHLAALIGIPYSYEAPIAYIRTNIEGSANVFQAARRFQVERVIQTSTSETYGSASYIPMDEYHPLKGQSPYSASKIGADKIAEAFHRSFDLPVTTVRPFNTYGPRQSARAVIPTIITQALNGSSIQLGNLMPTRDFNYVEDTVDGFIKAAACSAAIGETINIGSGTEISIGDLANTILSIVGGENLTIEHEQRRVRPDNSEVDRLCADNRKAGEILDWSQQFSLEKGLTQTVDWFRVNLNNFKVGSYAV